MVTRADAELCGDRSCSDVTPRIRESSELVRCDELHGVTYSDVTFELRAPLGVPLE